MTYAEMDKRRMLLPDLLGKPSGVTDGNGQMIFPSDLEIPSNHFIFFYPVAEWQTILEVRDEL